MTDKEIGDKVIESVFWMNEYNSLKAKHTMSDNEQRKSEVICLMYWLLIDLVWSVFLFSSAGYLVFAMHRSPLWFLLAILLGPGMGGGKLYKALAKHYGVEQ